MPSNEIDPKTLADLRASVQVTQRWLDVNGPLLARHQSQIASLMAQEGFLNLKHPLMDLEQQWAKLFALSIPQLDYGAIAQVVTIPDALNKEILSAFRPLLDSQQQWAKLLDGLGRVSTMPDIQWITAQNAALMSSAIADLGAISRSVFPELVLAGYPTLLADVGRLGIAYGAHVGQFLPANATQLPLEAQSLAGWTAPSLSTASYLRSVRLEVEARSDVPDHSGFDAWDAGTLDELLGQLNPRYVDMRRGAWLAIRSDNPDKVRHAASSHRELLRQVLEDLVPDSAVDPAVPGSKMKGRVRTLLAGSESSAELTVALGGAASNLYSYLSKVEHTDYRHEASVRGALVSGEGLLLFLLSQITAKSEP